MLERYKSMWCDVNNALYRLSSLQKVKINYIQVLNSQVLSLMWITLMLLSLNAQNVRNLS